MADSGEVWMAYGHEGSPQRFALVNSSVSAVQRLLRLWGSIVLSGRNEDDVAELLDRAGKAAGAGSLGSGPRIDC